MSSPFLDLDGNPINGDEVLGYGRAGLVVLRENIAVKMPLRYRSSRDSDVETNIEVLQHEKEVYQRLGQCEGVVPCIGFSETTIQLSFMANGDLRAYLNRNRPPRSLQLSWFRDMARTLARIHDRRVIVADIASRNFLLSDDLSIKFCDFTESSILHPDTDMENFNDNGYSIQTDIGQLGAVIYEVVTGKRCDFDLFKDQPSTISEAMWPRRENLPNVKDIWLGPIIDKCWTEGSFKNAEGVAKALDAITFQSLYSDDISKIPPEKGPQSQYSNTPSTYNISMRHTLALSVVVGIIALYTTWGSRRR
ncbi:hypothetical protein DTO282E5_5258 [Paecilomyces variotii]|nr:hypothetical protein DTO282E5_5258 [Paecilomyces variotii]